MEAKVVRESKFRHVFGKQWRKEVSLTNLRPSPSQEGSYIKANAKWTAIPWATGGGTLALIPTGKIGKLDDKWPLIDCHTSNLTDFDFNPFDDNVLATSARDQVIKLWKIPEKGIEPKVQYTPFTTLPSGEKRVNTLLWNPSANNVLLSTSLDQCVRLWDVEASKEQVKIEGHGDVVQSVSWNSDCSVFATSCKDKKLRVVDPRVKKGIIKEQADTHPGAKGFMCTFAADDRIVTTGQTKESARQIALWDYQSLGTSPPLTMQAVDSDSSSLLCPYYDEGTGLIFLAGKGTAIKYYEQNNSEPYLHLLSRFALNTTYSAVCRLPKRLCDVEACEVDRFFALTANTVETVSFNVPRKDTNLFQEDIFPPCASGEPSLTAAEWFSGKSAGPKTKSLKPAGAKSVFEVPEEQGGKTPVMTRRADVKVITATEADPSGSKDSAQVLSQAIQTSKSNRMEEGEVHMQQAGWIGSYWVSRWMSVEGNFAYCFEKQESPSALLIINYDDIESIDTLPDNYCPDKYSFALKVKGNKVYRFAVGSGKERDLWIYTLKTKPEPEDNQSQDEGGESNKQSEGDSNSSSSSSSSSEPKCEGELSLRYSGWIFYAWYTRYCELKGNMLYTYGSNSKADKENFLESFHLGKIISIIKTENIDKSYPFTFKMTTPFKAIHFAAPTKQERDRWLKEIISCTTLAVPDEIKDDENKDSSVKAQMKKTEGWIYRKDVTWGFGRWNKYWLVASGKDILYFTSPGADAPQLKATMDSSMTISFTTAPAAGTRNTEFNISMADGTKFFHKAESEDDCSSWMSTLEFLRKQKMDLLEELGIDLNELKAVPSPAGSRIGMSGSGSGIKVSGSGLGVSGSGIGSSGSGIGSSGSGIGVAGLFKGKKDEDGRVVIVDPSEVKKGRQKILIEVKGKRKLRVSLAEPSVSSLKSGGVFILDAGSKLYQWNGKQCSRVAKGKGFDVCNNIRTKERGGRAEVINLDQGLNDTNPNANEFWSALGFKSGGGPAGVEILDTEPSDSSDSVKVYRVADKDRVKDKEPIVKIVFEGAMPKRALLDTRNCCVIEAETEMYVWVGSKSRASQRNLAMQVARKLVDYNKHPTYTTITRVVEKGETILFKEKFFDFPDMLSISTRKQSIKGNVASTVMQEKLDVVRMHSSRPVAAADPIDDGSGKVLIWKVEDNTKVPVAESEYGELFMGESYLVLYTFVYRNKEKNIIFFWQGRDSSVKEKGKSAYLTRDLGTELENSEQIRTVNLKESQHFISIFKGNLVSRLGKREAFDHHQKALFQVAADSQNIIRTIEVENNFYSLNSCNCFVATSSTSTVIWIGKLSTAQEKEMAQNIAKVLADKINNRVNDNQSICVVREIEEGKEDDEFLRMVGGKKDWNELLPVDYASKCVLERPKRYQARLFLCTNVTGAVTVEEIFNYSQEDLQLNHIHILDTFYEVFVWIGKATALEKSLSMEAALEYIEKSPAGHLPSTPVWITYPYQEPITFTSHFFGWSRKSFPDAFQNPNRNQVVVLPVMDELAQYRRKTYTYAELTASVLPAGVDCKRLETYLTDQEFEQVFGMSREMWNKIPSWKKDSIKESFKLF